MAGVNGIDSNGNIKDFNRKAGGTAGDPSTWTTFDYAMAYIANGLSVIPIKPRDKAPATAWRPYQKDAPSLAEIRKWFEGTDNNIGIVTGKVSGNLVVLDFDDAKAFEGFVKALNDDLKDVIMNTWRVRTSRGYHVYLRVSTDKTVPSVKFNGVDVKAEGGYVVAPPSIHPSGARYAFVEPDMPLSRVIRVVTPEQFSAVIETVRKVTGTGAETGAKDEGGVTANTENPGPEPKAGAGAENGAPSAETVVEVSAEAQEPRGWRELSNDQILKIVEALKPVYRQGMRHDIVLYLTGWLYKAGVTYRSAEALVRALCDAYKDEECSDRLYALRDTYGIGRPLREDVLKREGKKLATKAGLYTTFLRKGVDENTAMNVLRKLEGVIGAPEPNPAVLIEKVDDAGERFAVVDYVKCEVLTARLITTKDGKDELRRDDRVILGCPEKLVAVLAPYSQIIKYDVTWSVPVQKRQIPLEGVTVEELLANLKANGLVLRRYKAEDVLNVVLSAIMRYGLAEFRTGFDAPGFYWLDDKLVAVKVDVRKPSQEEVREALELLNELVTKWFAKVQAQFVSALKLGLLMPFSFAVKQKFRGEKGFLPWLYLYGARDTGKTTTAEVLLHVFGVMNRQHELGLGEVNTEAKLGAALASDTFPHVVNEGASLFDKPGLVEIIKQAVEGLIARQRFETKTILKEYPAFAPLIITANEFRITDEALAQKRLVVLRYPIDAKLSPERIAEFRAKVAPRLPKSRALGQFVEWYLTEHPEELTYNWLDLGKRLLELAYQYAGVKPAFDLGLQHVEVEDYDPRLDIVAVLWRNILDAYNKKIMVVNEGGEGVPAVSPETIIGLVLDTNAVDFMVKRGQEVLITSKVVQILRDEGVNIDSMNTLVELFAEYGFGYTQRRVFGDRKKVVVVRLDDLLRLFHDFFNPDEGGLNPPRQV
jgi:hypothetical protein